MLTRHRPDRRSRIEEVVIPPEHLEEAGVDRGELVGEVLRVMKDLAAQGMTMLVVTHEMSFARDVADRVVFMDGGVVIESGSPAEVLDNPQQPRTKDFLANLL